MKAETAVDGQRLRQKSAIARTRPGGACIARRCTVFHYTGGPFNNAMGNTRVGWRDPQRRSYFSFASFDDPDRNGWLLQEIQTRLPGREWESTRS
ncbi:hypothetical protein [Nitrospira sp. Nam74]